MIDKMQVPDHWMKWLALLVNSVTVATVAYNTTAIFNCLLAIQNSFHLSLTLTQWVVNGYVLASASCLILAGKFADKFSHFKVQLAGLILFIITSVTIAITQAAWLLIVCRILQGVSAAIIVTSTLSSLRVIFPNHQRGLAISIWGGIIGLGFGLGPIIGGSITDFMSWRGIFWLNTIIMGAAILCLLTVLYHYRLPSRQQRIDYYGWFSLMGWLVPLILVLVNGQVWGFTSWPAIIAYIIVIVCFILFLLIESKRKDPLVELALFKFRGLSFSAIGIFLATINLFAFLLFFNIFFQWALLYHYSHVIAGVAMLTMNAAMFLASLCAPSLVTRFSLKTVIMLGMLLMAIAGIWLHFIQILEPFSTLWYKFIIYGIGLGLTFPIIPRVGLKTTPESQSGQASGIINTCNYIGATIAVSAGTIIYNAVSRAPYLNLSQLSTNQAHLSDTLISGSPKIVHQLMQSFASPLKETVTKALQMGSTNGFATIMLICGLIGAAGFVITFFLLPKES